jgi:type IV secretion system protein VirB10
MSERVDEREPPVSSRPRRLSQKQTYALTILGTGALIALVFWQNPGPRGEGGPEPPPSIGQRVAFDGLITAPPPPLPPSVEPPGLPASPSFFAPPDQASARPPRRMMSYATSAPARGADRSGAEGGGASRGSEPDDRDDRAQGTPTATTVRFGGTRIAGARAGAAIDTTLALMPGVYRCTLDTAVSSERPGPFFCHVTRDWLSPAGVRLVPAGTRIQGEYESHVGRGQSRVLSLAATAWTPEGVPVPLGASMGDALGRVGMEGSVDRHFWERFGGAVLLMAGEGSISLAQSAIQGALQQGGGNNTNLTLNTSAAQSAISTVLRDTVNMPNTVYLDQGDEVSVLLTKPIDFSDAYRLRSPR